MPTRVHAPHHLLPVRQEYADRHRLECGPVGRGVPGPHYVDIIETVLTEEEAALTDTSARRRAAQQATAEQPEQPEELEELGQPLVLSKIFDTPDGDVEADDIEADDIEEGDIEEGDTEEEPERLALGGESRGEHCTTPPDPRSRPRCPRAAGPRSAGPERR
ncbi:hypothetical protein [Streptomyces sp. NPDC002232]|uniref:hypothetical protein n=1 Tax=Streptomyces sp. NPDC002232 TaxID=3364640 RepID=UPI00368FC05B